MTTIPRQKIHAPAQNKLISRSDVMSSRERWLAALDKQEVDRLPFWAKIDKAYALHQTDQYRNMQNRDIHSLVGSERHDGMNSCIRIQRTRTDYESIVEKGFRRERFITPIGTLKRVNRFDPGSQSYHPVEFPIETTGDVKILTLWYEDQIPELNREALEKEIACQAQAESEQDTCTKTSIGISPLMEYVQHLADMQTAHLMLADHPDIIENLFAAMQRVIVRKAEIIAQHHPCDLIYLTENTSTTVISPKQYRKYCMPHIRAVREILDMHERRFCLHMCGKIQRLLPDLQTLGLDAFEAFTTPPLADTHLIDGRRECPDVCLIGGTDATLWIRPADEIISTIQQELDELPHHRGIVITSAGVMPPLCRPETIRTVSDWLQTYPLKM